METIMPNKLKLLKFIKRNPNTSIEEISRNLYDNNLKLAKKDIKMLHSVDYFITFKTKTIKTNDINYENFYTHINLNNSGLEYIRNEFRKKIDVYIPVLISSILSIIAIIISIIALLKQ